MLDLKSKIEYLEKNIQELEAGKPLKKTVIAIAIIFTSFSAYLAINGFIDEGISLSAISCTTVALLFGVLFFNGIDTLSEDSNDIAEKKKVLKGLKDMAASIHVRGRNGKDYFVKNPEDIDYELLAELIDLDIVEWPNAYENAFSIFEELIASGNDMVRIEQLAKINPVEELERINKEKEAGTDTDLFNTPADSSVTVASGTGEEIKNKACNEEVTGTVGDESLVFDKPGSAYDRATWGISSGTSTTSSDNASSGSSSSSSSYDSGSSYSSSDSGSSGGCD